MGPAGGGLRGPVGSPPFGAGGVAPRGRRRSVPNGRFRALDHDTGEILGEVNLGSPVTGFPVSYAVDGRQYIAVATGTGAGINLRMTPELRPSRGNNLFVFSLPN